MIKAQAAHRHDRLPPALIEYAVDPVGEATMMPSACTMVTKFLSTDSSSLLMNVDDPLPTSTSFKA